MALLQYLQRTDGLPDPRGSLSSAVPRQAIARANQEVQAAVDSEVEVRERVMWRIQPLYCRGSRCQWKVRFTTRRGCSNKVEEPYAKQL